MKAGARTIVYEAPTETKYRSKDALYGDCDIILISMCSVRKDSVGLYDTGPSLTPNLDSIAQNGYFFENAYSTSNFTLGGLSAILTGRFGLSTGVVNYKKGLPKDIFTLPQILSFYGYNTSAFTINAASGFRPEHGLDRGFLRMDITPLPRNTPDGRWQHDSKTPLRLDGDGASAIPLASWLSQQPTDKALFAMFHTRTAHYPFLISEEETVGDKTGISKALWNLGRKRSAQMQNREFDLPPGTEWWKGDAPADGKKDPVLALVEQHGQEAIDVLHKHYRSSIKRLDKDIGVVLEAQRKRGRFNKTIWVLLADHGESLYDHKELLHGSEFYNPVINIPMVVKIPGLSGQKKPIPALVSQVDILPTILDSVGAVPPANIDGTSMLPLLRKEQDSIRKVTLAAGGVAPKRGELTGAVVAPPWTLLLHDRYCNDLNDYRPKRRQGKNLRCLYNLESNPEQNLVQTEEEPQKVQELDKIWNYFLQKRKKRDVSIALDPKFVEELRRSGYDF